MSFQLRATMISLNINIADTTECERCLKIHNQAVTSRTKMALQSRVITNYNVRIAFFSHVTINNKLFAGHALAIIRQSLLDSTQTVA
jgi:hypothetical protein